MSFVFRNSSSHRRGRALLSAVTSAALLVTAWPSAEANEEGRVRCSSVAPIYSNVPSIGDRVGNISEWGHAICEPSDDVVRLVSRRPRFDNLGDPWLPVVVTGPHLGRRPGWMLCRRLELDEPCVDPSSIPVRPADG